ncbi:MAG: hypothetical protein RR346_01130 [Bacteroidales bacterium]
MRRLFILLSALCAMHIFEVHAEEQNTKENNKITEFFKKKKFNPDIKIGAGTILQTVFQETHDGGYLFEPAALKVGFLHFDMQVSEKLFTSVSWAFHSGKLSDAFIRYTFNPYLNLQIGRFKGAGTRAGHMTSLYDADFCDFTYTSENMTTDLGSGDFRHYGIDLSGKAKFVAYKFTLHNGLANRTNYYAGTNDGPALKNNGTAFKNWDGAISFFPCKNLEFGGHAGSRNRPGMGKDAIYSYSAFAYYTVENKFKLKADFATYTKPVFEEKVDEHDYTSSVYHPVKKTGASFLAGFQLSSRFEPIARYEYFRHGNREISGEKYEDLHMYTIGTNFFLFPKDKRKAKISLFYQFRDERRGEKIDNNWMGISYQVFFMR